MGPGKISGYAFTVVIPLVVSAMIPHLGLTFGLLLIAVSMFIGIADFVWLRRRTRKFPTEEDSRERRLQDKQDIKRLGLEAAQNPMPDMTIHDVFFHIRPDLLENHKEVRWRIVGDALRDKLSTQEIMAWGREIDPETKMVSPLVLIPATYWAKAEFVYLFLAEDRKREEGNSWTPGNRPTRNDYADIQFNRRQIFRIWPQKFNKIGIEINIPEAPRNPISDYLMVQGILKNGRENEGAAFLERKRVEADRRADYEAWDRVPVLSLIQAAQLWAGERPVEKDDDISQMAAIVLKELVAGANAGKLIAAPATYPDWMLFVGKATAAIIGADVGEHDRLSRATRENLRAYAVEKGERPLFVFPEDR
jgi:hypothetical protein